jgi:tagatose-1,6-bisphosphate aldolase
MDPHYSLSNLLPFNKSKGLVITLEEHSFTETKKGRYSKNIPNWSVEKIKRAGGDAVKVLLGIDQMQSLNQLNIKKTTLEKSVKSVKSIVSLFYLSFLYIRFKMMKIIRLNTKNKNRKKPNTLLIVLKNSLKTNIKSIFLN